MDGPRATDREWTKVDWAGLFLRSQGRIGRRRFWVGFAVLAALQCVACLAPLAGWYAFMILAYGWICLYAKRLHDIGRSGWLTLAPILASLLALSLAAAAFWQTTFTAKTTGASSLSWLGIVVVVAASLADLAFVAWVGLCPGEAGENFYGPGLGSRRVRRGS